LAVWRSGNGIGRINEATLRRARLVPGWGNRPSSGGHTTSLCNQPSRPTQPPTLSGTGDEPKCDDAVQLDGKGRMTHSIPAKFVSFSVCLSVCLLVTFVSPAKAAEPIEMPIGELSLVGPRKYVSDGDPDHHRRRDNFWDLSCSLEALGVSDAVYAAKGIVQSSTRWLYCVNCPQYSVRLEALGYLCTSCLLPTFDEA